MACSASGVGEVIMRACLAKECCQRMLNQALSVDEACSQVMQETTMQVLRCWVHMQLVCCSCC